MYPYFIPQGQQLYSYFNSVKNKPSMPYNGEPRLGYPPTQVPKPPMLDMPSYLYGYDNGYIDGYNEDIYAPYSWPT